jgi:predicted P-loop ATPase
MHLLAELGEQGLDLAIEYGACTVDADEAHALGFCYRDWRGGGLLLPFGEDFAQLRCDQPPINCGSDSLKYLNRVGASQCPAAFGKGEPTMATEGWKDALRLHLATGETVQALPGVTAHKLMAGSVKLLIYDADAAINPLVWEQLIRAGLKRNGLRLGFFPRELAGDKGGACEFFNAGGTLGTVKSWKSRELLRQLHTHWDKALRPEWQPRAIRKLTRLAVEAGFEPVAAEQLACTAARAIGLPVSKARSLARCAVQAAVPQSALTETAPRCPQEPTKRQLQQFLRRTHEIRFNTLTQLVEIDGQPAEDIDLADSLLAHVHGIETTKQAARDSLIYVARSNPRNPIADYLTGLREKPWLNLLSIEVIAVAFGIRPEDKLSQELLARHLAGAYRRGMKPGYKHDQMLILCGDQGQGKGEAIKALVSPRWYGSATRVVKGLEDREFLTTVNSVWGFEFDECEKVLLGRDASEFKGFTTRDRDRYVQKYETVSREHPRRSVLFGTSNETEILNDPTGSRRYWLIDVRGGSLDPAWIMQNRDSIWATVATWVDWGLENWLPPSSEVAIQAAERAAQSRLSEPLEGEIARFLDRLPVEGKCAEGVAQETLIREALQVAGPIKIDRRLQMTVTRIVTASDFRTHGGRVRWVKRKARYGDGPPRSGYMPKSVPDDPTCPNESFRGWNSVRPWEDKSLASLFQRFQPNQEQSRMSCSRLTSSRADSGASTYSASAYSQPPGENGWNTSEPPCGAIGLSTPTSSEEDKVRLEQPLPRSGQPDPLAPGDAVEVWNTVLGCWQNGWQLVEGPDLDGLFLIEKVEGRRSQHVRHGAIRRCSGW